MSHLPDKFGQFLKQTDHLQVGRCPHCSVADPVLTKKYSFSTNDNAGGYTRDWTVYVCETCGGVVLAGGPHGKGLLVDETYPRRAALDGAIPERARVYLKQAIETVHAPAGSVMLAASSVDAMLKAKGYVDDTLYARIEEAARDHVITAEMASWAHEVRLDANDQRHADESGPLPDAPAARKCVDFATALAELMFVLPARVERGRMETTDLPE